MFLNYKNFKKKNLLKNKAPCRGQYIQKPVLEKEIGSPLKVEKGVDIVDEEMLDEIIIGEAREKT